jgi:hypothetical protein
LRNTVVNELAIEGKSFGTNLATLQLDLYAEISLEAVGHQPSMFLTPISLASMMPGVIEGLAH